MSTFRLFFLIIIFSTLTACNEKGKPAPEQTVLSGSAAILVDETLTPIIQDQVIVFESEYDANIDVISRSEAEVVNSLLRDSARIAILARRLNAEEMKVFQQRKIVPRITQFAIDGVAFIKNNQDKDTLVNLADIIKFMKGDTVAGIEGLVFDNPNSSTARYLAEVSGLQNVPQKGIFSFKNNEEAIKYISENEGMVGVVGLNWILQPPSGITSYMKEINVLNVKGLSGGEYYSPTQNNIAEGKYPLARDLFIVDCQGFAGLGMGFSSFIAGERGQRIVLKSGLLPVRIPGRKIVTRSEIQKTK